MTKPWPVLFQPHSPALCKPEGAHASGDLLKRIPLTSISYHPKILRAKQSPPASFIVPREQIPSFTSNCNSSVWEALGTHR